MAGVSAFISLEELEKTSTLRSYGPGASFDVRAPSPAAMRRQQALPELYREFSPEEIDSRIGAAKAVLGKDLVVLGHHYQRDEIIKFADFRGDSFKLSQLAAGCRDAQYVVFCGVYFMAESADILTRDDQTVILPNLTAGCSMADMANIADVTVAWSRLGGSAGSLVPVTYMNSAADLKAFCGEHGGIVCTSSNAAPILSWAFEKGTRVLFFPDEHLGRNTADRLEISQEDVSVWDPRHVEESEEAARHARLIVWKGFCSVHERFTVGQIEQARRDHPGCTVIVHPECRREVVHAADLSGSTELIVHTIENAAPGTTFAVGTEINLVNRLAAEHPEMTIFCLDPVVCPCSTMYRIHPAYLAWALDNLVDGLIVNRVTVPADVAHWARLALNRMLEVTAGAKGAPAVLEAVG
jgi:quinolinate synthase